MLFSECLEKPLMANNRHGSFIVDNFIFDLMRLPALILFIFRFEDYSLNICNEAKKNNL